MRETAALLHLDDQPGDDPAKRQRPANDPDDFQPIPRIAGLGRGPFDPIVPRPLSLDTGAMIMTEISAELGLFLGRSGAFHGWTI